jgi:tRNA (cmo5U34)-methyltransferase
MVANWNEETSRLFIDYGRYFVPQRQEQIELIVSLLPGRDGPGAVFELCCGEGLLAEAILAAWPASVVHGLDGSPEMLQRAQARCARFGGRFKTALFDLAALDWRAPGFPVQAVVSSLAIHHLDGLQKQALFADVYRMLAPGGALIIADVVQHPGEAGRLAAAEAWDAGVRRQALEIDGNLAAFDFFQREGWNMHRGIDPDDIDQPSTLFDQLTWLAQAGFHEVDVHWMLAGHAIFSGRKR